MSTVKSLLKCPISACRICKVGGKKSYPRQSVLRTDNSARLIVWPLEEGKDGKTWARQQSDNVHWQELPITMLGCRAHFDIAANGSLQFNHLEIDSGRSQVSEMDIPKPEPQDMLASKRPIGSMTVPELKAELKARGRRNGGNKGELVDRLRLAVAEDYVAAQTAEPRPVAAAAPAWREYTGDLKSIADLPALSVLSSDQLLAILQFHVKDAAMADLRVSVPRSTSEREAEVRRIIEFRRLRSQDQASPAPRRPEEKSGESKAEAKADAMDVAPPPSSRPRRTYQPTAAALNLFASGINAFSAREQNRHCCSKTTGFMLTCSRKDCANGGKVHPKCVGMKQDAVLFLTTGPKEKLATWRCPDCVAQTEAQMDDK